MSTSFALPTLLEGWLPPNRQNWELIVWSFQFFPIFTAIQYLTDFYPQGKTSIRSRFNIPGPLAWFLMETPGMLIAWYCFLTIPVSLPSLTTSSARTLDFVPPRVHPFLDLPASWSERSASVPPSLTPWDLPVGNKLLLGLYTTHYIYRAVLSPLYLNPSMSPIHVTVFISAFAWQLVNGLSIGGWLAGYGKNNLWDWAGGEGRMPIGLVIWGWAWLGNMFCDDELREIRREAARRQRQSDAETKNPSTSGPQGQSTKDARGSKASKAKADPKETTQQAEARKQKAIDVSKVYTIPHNFPFTYILYPHYLAEWLEWTGFWMVGGWTDFRPGRTFVVNEVATMLPRALGGWRWYVGNFGRERIGKRKAVIPFLL